MKQEVWGDMTAPNTMPAATVELSARQTTIDGVSHVTILIKTPSERIAFFERASVSDSREGGEILPIEYNDNYVTVYPGEAVELRAKLPRGAKAGWVKLEGHNTAATVVSIK